MERENQIQRTEEKQRPSNNPLKIIHRFLKMCYKLPCFVGRYTTPKWRHVSRFSEVYPNVYFCSTFILKGSFYFPPLVKKPKDRRRRKEREAALSLAHLTTEGGKDRGKERKEVRKQEGNCGDGSRVHLRRRSPDRHRPGLTTERGKERREARRLDGRWEEGRQIDGRRGRDKGVCT